MSSLDSCTCFLFHFLQRSLLSLTVAHHAAAVPVLDSFILFLQSSKSRLTCIPLTYSTFFLPLFKILRLLIAQVSSSDLFSFCALECNAWPLCSSMKQLFLSTDDRHTNNLDQNLIYDDQSATGSHTFDLTVYLETILLDRAELFWAAVVEGSRTIFQF